MPKPKITSRLFWGEETANLPQLDLTLIQRESYQWFLKEGIFESLQEISPIEDFTGKNWILEFGKHVIGKPKHTPSQALEKGLTYDFPLRAQTTLVNKQTGERVEQEVFLGDLPAMTEQGTFVVNGIERCVVNQLVRSPGVFFTGEPDPITGRMLNLERLGSLARGQKQSEILVYGFVSCQHRWYLRNYLPEILPNKRKNSYFPTSLHRTVGK